MERPKIKICVKRGKGARTRQIFTKKEKKQIQTFLHPGFKIKLRKNTSIKSFVIFLRVWLRSVQKNKKYVEKSSIMINQIRVCKYGSQEALGPFSESGEKKTCPWRVKKKKSSPQEVLPPKRVLFMKPSLYRTQTKHQQVLVFSSTPSEFYSRF